MNELLRLFAEHGPLLVFANVLVEQLGAPLPAVPLLVIAGSLVADGHFPFALVLVFAMAGSGIANVAWFLAGRRYGRRVLRTVCRITLSPDVCVRQTENVYVRWGVAALLVARFVPGLSSVASPLAGTMGMRLPSFMLFDALGTGLWATAALAAGMVFHRQVDRLLEALAAYGGNALAALVALFAAYLLVKWLQRLRLLRFLRASRITVDELAQRLESDSPPVVVDVRSDAARSDDARGIPGALAGTIEGLPAQLAHLPRDTTLVLYCACPNEASAAKAAKRLMAHGFRRVHPLAGGLDAWMAYQAPADGAPARAPS